MRRNASPTGDKNEKPLPSFLGAIIQKMRNKTIFRDFKEKVRIEKQEMGCRLLVFQSEFSEHAGAITFIYQQVKVIAPDSYANRYLPAALHINLFDRLKELPDYSSIITCLFSIEVIGHCFNYMDPK